MKKLTSAKPAASVKGKTAAKPAQKAKQTKK